MPPPSHSVRAQTLHTELALYRAELLASTTSSPMGTTPANSDEVDDPSLERRAKAVLNEHIRMLHEYNEVKDAVEVRCEARPQVIQSRSD